MPEVIELGQGRVVKQNTPATGESFGAAGGFPNRSVSSEAELNSAITSLGVSGGVILVSKAFAISSQVIVSSPILIQGRLRAAQITFSGSGELVLQDESRMRDVAFTTDKTSGNLISVTGNKTRIQECLFSVSSANPVVCINVNGSVNKIENSIFSGVVGGSAVGIEFAGGSGNIDIDNIFE